MAKPIPLIVNGVYKSKSELLAIAKAEGIKLPSGLAKAEMADRIQQIRLGREKPKPVRCRFSHHEEYGQEISCTQCSGPLSCGPFRHACRNCNPRAFDLCYVCQAERVFCAC